MDEVKGHEAVPKGWTLWARAGPERLARTIITITTTNETAMGTGKGRNAKRKAVLQHHATEHLATTQNITPTEVRMRAQNCQ